MDSPTRQNSAVVGKKSIAPLGSCQDTEEVGLDEDGLDTPAEPEDPAGPAGALVGEEDIVGHQNYMKGKVRRHSLSLNSGTRIDWAVIEHQGS